MQSKSQRISKKKPACSRVFLASGLKSDSFSNQKKSVYLMDFLNFDLFGHKNLAF